MLHLTSHKKTSDKSNKMDGMISINTLPTLNSFCMAMREDKSNICFACYCKRSECYPGLKKAFTHNTEMLSSDLILKEDLPKINHIVCRFNAFGELMNKIHYKNLVRIAKHNPLVTFALWTKRVDMVDIKIKPKNMILILSSPKKDVQAELPKGFDKVFTVYSKGYLREHTDTVINCGAKSCITCRKCYSLDNTETYINETLK